MTTRPATSTATPVAVLDAPAVAALPVLGLTLDAPAVAAAALYSSTRALVDPVLLAAAALDAPAADAVALAVAVDLLGDELDDYRHGTHGRHHAAVAELNAPPALVEPLALLLIAVELLALGRQPAPPDTRARKLTAAPAAPPTGRPVVGRA